MRREMLLVLLLALAIAVPVRAQVALRDGTARFTEGTPVVLVGQVLNDPALAGGAMQDLDLGVGTARTGYRLRLASAQIVGLNGQTFDAGTLRNGAWVRAQGFVMDDPRRVHVTNLQFIGPNQNAAAGSPFFRPAAPQGFIEATGQAGPAPQFPAGTGLQGAAEVIQAPDGPGEQRFRVVIAGGREYTIHVSDALLRSGFNPSLLANGSWIFFEGAAMDDPRGIRAGRIQVIGPGIESFRRSTFYRPGSDLGYLTAVAGSLQTYRSAQTIQAKVRTPVAVVGQFEFTPEQLRSGEGIRLRAGSDIWPAQMAGDVTVIGVGGERFRVRDLQPGVWYRAVGWQDSDGIRVLRIEAIGPDESYRRSAYYRGDQVAGYRTELRELPDTLRRWSVRGTITEVNAKGGFVVVTDLFGHNHRVDLRDADLFIDGQVARIEDIRLDDLITVEGKDTRF